MATETRRVRASVNYGPITSLILGISLYNGVGLFSLFCCAKPTRRYMRSQMPIHLYNLQIYAAEGGREQKVAHHLEPK